MDEPQLTVVRANAQGPAGTLGVAGEDTSTPTTVIQMPIWKMILVRVARVYLVSLVGFLTISSTGIAAAAGVPIDRFGGAIAVAATLAVAPTVMSLALNAIEFLTKLDVTWPGLRA